MLLGTDPESNLEIIMILSTAEMSATVVVGALPCISSAFVRKYVGNSCEKTFFSWKGSIAQRYQKRTSFVQVHGDGSSQRAKGNWLKLSRTTSQRMSGHFECASTAGVTEDDIRERDIETTITTTLSVS